MKLSLITETFPPEINGVAMTLHRVASGLVERGHTVEVICPQRADRAAFLESDRFALRMVPGVPIPGYGDLRFGLPAMGRLKKAWRASPPDLVHIATEGPLGWSASRAARSLNLPFVTTYHTHFHRYSGHYGYGSLRTVIFWWLKRMRRNARRTFVPSEELREELREEGFQNLSILSRGVDTQLFGPPRRDLELRASWGVEGEEPVALYVGRVAGEKNLPLTIQAWQRMRAALPDLPLVIVGDGPEQARLARQHPAIIFAGPRRGEELARYYASGDIFLFASTTETFGNVVTEAMASGLVVLGYDYAAARCHLRSGENGVTVPLHDGAAYLTAAASLATSPLTHWTQLRTAARATAERISWQAVLDGFERELVGLVSPRRIAFARFLLMNKISKKAVLHFRTIVLSDVHLGAPDCQIDAVNEFLKHTHAPKLILNGDIIDGWSLGRNGGWTTKHTRFIRLVLKKIEKRSVEVIYLRGNHDDILERFLPLSFGRLQIVEKHIHESVHGPYLVVHGDVFDAVTQNSKLMAVVGDIGYQTLMRINRGYNRYRSWRGRPPFSLSKAIKSKTKSIVNYISRFEENVESFTLKEACVGFICGHIHTPDDKRIGSIHYLNSGDWVESGTALVEHFDGRWEILDYPTFRERLEEEERRRRAEGVHAPIEEDTDENGRPMNSSFI